MAPGPLPDMALGQPGAPVTIVEYASLSCSHCAKFDGDVLDALKTSYIDTGKVYYVFREFRSTSSLSPHPQAARCEPQDRFFTIVRALFHNQNDWAFAADPLRGLIIQLNRLGMTSKSSEACLSNAGVIGAIDKSRRRANKEFHVGSTPTFFINGEAHFGGLDFAAMQAILDPLLTGR